MPVGSNHPYCCHLNAGVYCPAGQFETNLLDSQWGVKWHTFISINIVWASENETEIVAILESRHIFIFPIQAVFPWFSLNNWLV